MNVGDDPPIQTALPPDLQADNCLPLLLASYSRARSHRICTPSVGFCEHRLERIGLVNFISLNAAIGSDNLWLIRPNIQLRGGYVRYP